MKVFLTLMVAVYSLFGGVDINHADAKALMTLKGMGEVKASRVVEFRKQNGCFLAIEDLKKVKGIGVGFLKKNKENLDLTPCK